MAPKKICRVCGKEYEACRSAVRTPGVFRWQEVSCSPECGQIYLQRILDSRKPAEAQKKSKKKKDVEVVVDTITEIKDIPVEETVDPVVESYEE